MAIDSPSTPPGPVCIQTRALQNFGLCQVAKGKWDACDCNCVASVEVCMAGKPGNRCWPSVATAPGEPDPTSQSCSGKDASFLTLQVSPTLEASPSGWPAFAASIDNQTDATPFFGMGVVRPGEDVGGQGKHFGSSPWYTELIKRLSAKVHAELNDTARRVELNVPGIQHVIAPLSMVPRSPGASARPGASLLFSELKSTNTRNVSFKNELVELVDLVLVPYVARTAFFGVTPMVKRVSVSRNVMFAEEQHSRSKAMLWHWDAIAWHSVKVIVHLSAVSTNASGCFVALRHPDTGATHRMRSESIFGSVRPPPVPRPWVLSLFNRGFRPFCVTGPPGTVVAFSTNIVHRGSRPGPGLYRDAVLVEFLLPRSRRSQVLKRMQETAAMPTLAVHDPPRPSRRILGRSHVQTHEPLASSVELTGETQGRRMPMVGFGAANRASARGPKLMRSLASYFSVGGRLIDTSQMYGNHKEIGRAFRQSKLSRDSLWLISKIQTWYRMPNFVNTTAGTVASIRKSLSDLGLGFLDVMLIHYPFGLSVKGQLDVWRGLIAAKQEGLVTHVGVSNFNRAQIELLVAETGIWPAVHEMEFHPWVHTQARELVRWCQEKGIVVVAYGSLGGRKHTNRTTDSVASLASAHGVSQTQILLRWAQQQGVVTIPGATSLAHISDNLAVLKMPGRLREQDLRAIEDTSHPATWAYTGRTLCPSGVVECDNS